MTPLQLAADIADTFRDWFDGDDPVTEFDYEPFDGTDAQMGVSFESGAEFIITIVSP